jgi:hypothetical protein
MNRKITPNSRDRVIRLMTPPTDRTQKEQSAPRGLTVKKLMRHARYEKLRTRYTVIEIVGGGLIPIRTLETCGFCLTEGNDYI